MIENLEMDNWLDQMLSLGESFTFENGKVENNKEHFELWLSKAKEFLLKNNYLTEDKITRQFYHNDETYYTLLSGYLTKIYLSNANLL
jgi:hypothetical protein